MQSQELSLELWQNIKLAHDEHCTRHPVRAQAKVRQAADIGKCYASACPLVSVDMLHSRLCFYAECMLNLSGLANPDLSIKYFVMAWQLYAMHLAKLRQETWNSWMWSMHC